jgi:hypothetical protein
VVCDGLEVEAALEEGLEGFDGGVGARRGGGRERAVEFVFDDVLDGFEIG